jgi:hypothetical protein
MKKYLNLITMIVSAIILSTSWAYATTVSCPGNQACPSGSYRESCLYCTYDIETKSLTCKCRNHKGEYHYKTITGCGCYKNDDGNLKCERCPLPVHH